VSAVATSSSERPLRRRVSIVVPPLVSVALAGGWVLLAAVNGGATYHFAPLVVAASWGAGQRWTAGGAVGGQLGTVAAVGGALVAVAATVLLAVAARLDGPTLRGGGSALVETLLFTALGAALGYRFATRRRGGLLFGA
jgi:hypothetical protein